MDFTDPPSVPDDTAAIIVKADEVDESGADISTISPTDNTPSEFEARIETRRAQDAQVGGTPRVLANAVASAPKPSTRPILRREGSAPPPPQQPPPPAPPQQRDAGATDSLSLQQLRRLVTDLPKLEPIAYAYNYEDTRSFPEELDEWFQYTEEERYMLLRAKQTFIEKWEQAQATRIDPTDNALEWTDVEETTRKRFIEGALQALESSETATRIASLECISYIALGAWAHTAGLASGSEDGDMGVGPGDGPYTKSTLQLKWIRKGAGLLSETGAAQKLLVALRRLAENEQDSDLMSPKDLTTDDDLALLRFNQQLEINQVLTALYLLVEVGRWESSECCRFDIQEAIASLQPGLLSFLTYLVAKLRWDEASQMPLPRVTLLLWKSTLLLFGNSKRLSERKRALRDPPEDNPDLDSGFIVTSPLDYHLFRQEITSKYPAYSPPAPLLPIELENNSILPPLPNHPSRRPDHDTLQARSSASTNGNPGSIFNQPVHIATPAPSPPPSPAGPGGKAGKKQNYQTNQNFPFLYPPLDDTSNTVGGKGSAEVQDKLVGKRWEGSDVPASIQEAGQLFASRMRMSRPMRQLWEVREDFMKFERGYHGNPMKDETISIPADTDDDDDDDRKPSSNAGEDDKVGYESGRNDHPVQDELDAVEEYYRNSLPHFQSLIVVFWKLAVSHVSTMASQNGANGQGNGVSFSDDNLDGPGKRKQNCSSLNLNGTEHGQLAENGDGTDPEVEELNALRTREITLKAIAGTLLQLLKWFKLSHILKFEYLTQLLLDSNYLPLILKLFAHQDVDRAVEQRNDRDDLNFFSFCRLHSTNSSPSPPQPSLSPSASSDDEAAPPPILKHRRSPSSHSPPPSPPPPQPRPEVDELGYPTTSLLESPLTTYSPRFFFTTITLLRILQKITKRKAHRALLLVQYKSSTILRRALKIPQPELRLYTLKLFKSQVPYCGRKWRQTNMRVITAIYLHCRPELRDEWLCGGDVDGVVEEAVPLEQAMRALVHWWHLRNYRAVMEGKGAGEGNREGKQEQGKDSFSFYEDEEIGFFERELERMGWGPQTILDDVEEDARKEEEERAAAVGNEFEGGPLQMEGWA